MNTTQQNATKFGIAASRQWWRDARELAISFGPTLEDAIVAYIKLNFRDEVAQTAPSIEFYYSLLSTSFLTMYDAEIVNPIYPVTALGQEFIDQIRRATGIGVQSLPAPEPFLTPAQKLEQQVKDDWKRLPSGEIKKKIANDRAYRETFERVSAGLESSPMTSHVVIPGA